MFDIIVSKGEVLKIMEINSSTFGVLTIDSKDEDAFFDNVSSKNFHANVNIYIDNEVIKCEKSLEKVTGFLDNIDDIDLICRAKFNEDKSEMVTSYFDFFKEEAPDVFGTDEVSELTLHQMVSKLELVGINCHETTEGLLIVVDYSLGYDQLLCVNFDGNHTLLDIGWES